MKLLELYGMHYIPKSQESIKIGYGYNFYWLNYAWYMLIIASEN
jgi:hypothetical protein